VPLAPVERPRQTSFLTDFSGGVNLDQPLPSIPQNEAIAALGCIWRKGSLDKVGGAQQVGDTIAGNPDNYLIFQFLRMDAGNVITRQELVVWNQTLYLNVGGVWTSQGALGGGTQPMSAVQYTNRVFLSDGVDDPYVWNGAAVNPLQKVNPPAPTVPVIGAWAVGGYLSSLSAYKVRAKYYSSTTGDLSDRSPPLSIAIGDAPVGDNQKNTVTIDPLAGVPARFDRVRIYRTRADQTEELFELESGVFDPAVGGTIEVGTKLDANLGAICATDDNPMNKCQLVYLYDDRLFAAGDPDAPTTLYRSKADARPCAWPILEAMELDKEDGFPITGMRELNGRLYVFKRNKTYQIGPDPVTTYAVKTIPTQTGLLSHWAVTKADNILWGAGEKSFWVFNGAQMKDISRGKYSEVFATDDIGTASNTDPLYLVADPEDDNDRIVVGLPEPGAGEGGTGGFIVKGTRAFFEHPNLNRRIVLGERSNGKAYWLAEGLPGGADSGMVLELFRDSSDVLIEDFLAANITQRWRSASLDPEPSIPHKLFMEVHVLMRLPDASNPDDTWTYKIFYDDEPTSADETGTIGPYGAETGDVQVFPFRLDGRIAQRVSIQVENSVASRKAFRLVGLRLVWKPLGRYYSL